MQAKNHVKSNFKFVKLAGTQHLTRAEVVLLNNGKDGDSFYMSEEDLISNLQIWGKDKELIKAINKLQDALDQFEKNKSVSSVLSS